MRQEPFAGHFPSMRLGGLAVSWVCSACAGAATDDATTPLTGIVLHDDSTGDDASGSDTDADESTTALVEDDDGSAPATTTGASADESGESTGGAPPVGGICMPIDSDTECTACSKANCCAQLMACASDPSCGCYMTCVATTADVFGCGTECGVDLYAPGPVGDLIACSSGPCVAACT